MKTYKMILKSREMSRNSEFNNKRKSKILHKRLQLDFKIKSSYQMRRRLQS